MKAVRRALFAGAAVLVGCASGAPAIGGADSGTKTFAPVTPGGSGGMGGMGGKGAMGGGSGGSGGSHYMDVPLIFPDANFPDAAPMDAAMDAGPPTYTCDDGKKNGHETSADCGGADCDPCAIDKSCVTNDDCESKLCGSAFTCTMISCMDKQLNQDESDVDCGGMTCGQCVLGKKCAQPEDCDTGSCSDGGTCACVPTATCAATECASKPDGCGGTLMCPNMCTGCSGGLGVTNCCRRDGKCGCTGVFGIGCD